jgi:hypothetical protein
MTSWRYRCRFCGVTFSAWLSDAHRPHMAKASWPCVAHRTYGREEAIRPNKFPNCGGP